LYGGAYSPTTFNLALFMDRLFRSEIEQEEKERAREAEVDPQPYLMPEPEPEPEVEEVQPATGGGKGLWIGLAAALVAVAVTLGVVLVPRLTQPPPPVVPPTPTAEEIAARDQAEKERLQALIDAEVGRMMAEQEDRMRADLMERQKKIDDLQRQLRAAEQAADGAGSSAEAQREAEEIKRRLAAEEEAKRLREKELEDERQKAEALARKQAEEAAKKEPTPEPEPTVVEVKPSPTPAPVIRITENQFLDPSEVSTPPEVLKKAPVSWSPIAMRSRRRGVVIVQATVNAQGRVDEVKVLRADETGFGIADSALAAAKQYVFKPAIRDGVKVKTFATITIPYNFANMRRP
jgi:TonB family protein